jgi:sugar lactone lactonase YvrE
VSARSHRLPLRPGFGLASVTDVGIGLNRPECVLCTANGDVFVSDWRGGVTRIAADGRQTLIAAVGAPLTLKPNGIALDKDGTFLLAQLDDRVGGVYRLRRDGTVIPFLLEVDGQPLPSTNFALIDDAGRVWITVMTRHVPRQRARYPGCADGYVVLVDKRGARIVADGIGFANECRFDPSGEWLYVNETWARCISRFRVDSHGNVGPREVFIAFDTDVYPDGLAFDDEGGLWLASVYSNRVLRIAPDRAIETIVDDSDEGFVDQLARDFASGALVDGRATLDQPWRRLGSISSVAFGGRDRKTLYIGCLLDNRIYRMGVPVRGVRPSHWEVVVPV